MNCLYLHKIYIISYLQYLLRVVLRPVTQEAAGSSPVTPAIFFPDNTSYKPDSSRHLISQAFNIEIDACSCGGASQENKKHLSDKESKIIDSLRAQYKHNEIPKELLEIIEIWSDLPPEIHNALTSIVAVHQ